MSKERDTKFQEYAYLLYPELSKLFFTMYARISELRQIEEIDAVEDEIKTLLARRAYDLVEHILNQTPTGTLYISLFKDMTEWPEQRAFGDALADLAKNYQKLMSHENQRNEQERG